MIGRGSLSAILENGRGVMIGRDPLSDLRRFSDARRLACPACRASVILRAGPILAPHFAHMAGAECSRACGEPETEEHRTGKDALAAWLRERIPDAHTELEAFIAETGQRADIRVNSTAGPFVIEFQCADLDWRQWRRRHCLYRAAGLRDLWVLGGSRLKFHDGILAAGDLERALLRAGAPLLFYDPLGRALVAGSLARFRPNGAREGRSPRGVLSARPLAVSGFNLDTLDWPDRADIAANPVSSVRSRRTLSDSSRRLETAGDPRVVAWLQARHHVQLDTIQPLFGVALRGAEVFGCSPAIWQAALYCRFVEGCIGQAWRPGEVEIWARRYLPVAVSAGRPVRRAIREFAAYLSAAGLLSVPGPDGRARIEFDLLTLGREPDPAAALRLLEYRRTLAWDRG